MKSKRLIGYIDLVFILRLIVTEFSFLTIAKGLILGYLVYKDLKDFLIPDVALMSLFVLCTAEAIRMGIRLDEWGIQLVPGLVMLGLHWWTQKLGGADGKFLIAISGTLSVNRQMNLIMIACISALIDQFRLRTDANTEIPFLPYMIAGLLLIEI